MNDIPDRVVRRAWNNEIFSILKTRNASLVSIQCSDKLAVGSIPNFDASISRCRDDVLLVKINDIDSRSMTNQYSSKRNVSRRVHVPNGDWSVFTTCNHKSIGKPQMKDSLAVMNQSVNHEPSIDIPNSNSCIRRSRDDDFVIVLKTEYRSCMSCQDLRHVKRTSIPDLDCVVSKSRHDFLVIVLQTVNPSWCFRSTVDSLKVVSILRRPPVDLQVLSVHYNGRI